jgi:hypothetical protein
MKLLTLYCAAKELGRILYDLIFPTFLIAATIGAVKFLVAAASLMY